MDRLSRERRGAVGTTRGITISNVSISKSKGANELAGRYLILLSWNGGGGLNRTDEQRFGSLATPLLAEFG